MTWFSRAAYFALWIFVFSIPSERAILIPGFGTFTKVLGFASAGLGILAIILERRVRVPSMFHKILALFMLWSGLTLSWTVSPEDTAKRLNTYLQLYAMILLIWQFAPLQKRINGLATAYVLGTFVNIIDTTRLFISGVRTTPQYYQRYASTGTEPNDLAVALALSVPASYYLWLHCRERWNGTKWFWLAWIFPVQIVGVCLTVLLSASRGGSITLLLALTVVFWMRRALTPRTRWNLVLVACLGVALVAYLVPASSFTRLATSGSELTEGTANGRTVIWQEGWKVFGKTPFKGVGVGAYPDAVIFELGRREHFNPVAHNTFYSVLVETGIVGFLLFAAVLTSLVAALTRMAWPHRQVWALTLAVWAVGVFSLSWEDRKPMWFVFAMTMAQSEIFRRERARKEPEAVPEVFLNPAWQEVSP